MLGPEPITRAEETAANKFKHRVLAQAEASLDAACRSMQKHIDCNQHEWLDISRIVMANDAACRRIFGEAFSNWSVRCWHGDADSPLSAGHDGADEEEDPFLSRADFVAFVRENSRMSSWFVGEAVILLTLPLHPHQKACLKGEGGAV